MFHGCIEGVSRRGIGDMVGRFNSPFHFRDPWFMAIWEPIMRDFDARRIQEAYASLRLLGRQGVIMIHAHKRRTLEHVR